MTDIRQPSEPLTREAFESLIGIHHHRVLKRALAMSGDPFVAADIVQQTWLRAWTRRHTLRNLTAFGAWVNMICQREGWAMLRRAGDVEPLNEEAVAAPIDDRAQGDAEKVAMLYAGLSKLGADDIELLSLKYFSGYSMRRIGVWLGIPAKTVKSRLFAARRRLYRAIGQSDESHLIERQFIQRRERIMEKVKLLEVGASCLVRMSLQGQQSMLRSARENEPFGEDVLQELKGIERGAELLALCDGKLDINEFMWILAGCDPWLGERLISPRPQDRERLLDSAPGGYTILETAPVMTVPDLEATVAWFIKTLGWNGGVDARDSEGRAVYGCVLLGEGVAVNQRLRPFNGIHLFQGQAPAGGYTIAMLYVSGLGRLRERVTASGWDQITEIESTPWAGGVCNLTTMDGYVLRLFETA